MRIKNKIIHIVGGGHGQYILAHKAKELGAKILVTDMYANPPCKSIADFFEQVDIYDRESILRVSKNHKISAVLTDQSDVALPTVAYVAEQLKLPGIGTEIAKRFTNKFSARSFLKQNLSEQYRSYIPSFHPSNDPQQIYDYLLEYRMKKFTIKPINSQGTKGLILVEANKLDEKSLKNLIEASLAKTDGLLIEEFIDGYELAIESYVYDKQVYPLAFSKKYPNPNNICLDKRVEFYDEVYEPTRSILIELNRLAITTLGFNSGLCHAQYRIDSGIPYLTEITARGAGSNISGIIVPYISNFDNNSALVHLATGNFYPLPIAGKDRFAVIHYFDLNISSPVRITQIKIPEQCYELVLEIKINIQVGDIIYPDFDHADRIGYAIIVSSSSKKQVQSKLSSLLALIEIDFEVLS